MNLSTVKWAQSDKTQSRELLGLFMCVCIALCTIVAHNTAQNRPDNFPCYPPDNHHCSTDVHLREGGKVDAYVRPTLPLDPPGASIPQTSCYVPPTSGVQGQIPEASLSTLVIKVKCALW